MATTATEREVNIRDVQAIESLTIKLPAEGGVTEIRGRNGAGKSTALNCVRRALGNEDVRLEPRDGKKRGMIDVGEVHISIASRTTSVGECEIGSVESRFDISALINPGIASAERADAARIKELLRLRQVTADPALFARSLGEDLVAEFVSADTLKCADLVEMAGRVKRDLEKAARDAESKRDIEIGHAQANKEKAAGIDVDVETDEAKLRAVHDEAVKQSVVLRTRRDESSRRKVSIDAAKEKLAEAHASYGGPTAEEARGDLHKATDRVEAARNHLNELQLQVTKAVTDLRAEEAAMQLAEAKLDSALDREKTLGAWQQTIAQGELPGPTDDELQAANDAVDKAAVAIRLGITARQAKTALEAAERHAADAKQHAERAARLRDAGKMTDDVLSEAVQSGDLRVVGGRLVTKTERMDDEPFAELSDGLRARIAIREAAALLPEWGIVTVSQGVWGELSPETKREVHAHARELKIHVLTVVATDEDLNVAAFDEPTAREELRKSPEDANENYFA